MKKYKRYLVWGSALLVIFTLALSQYPAYYTIIVRTFLDVRGKAVVNDSLRVGTSTPVIIKADGTITSKAITSTGLTTQDSLAVNGEARIGGLVEYDQRFSVKNDAVNSNLVNFFNSRNSSMFKVDSTGKITAVGLTTTGSITATSQTIASGAITSSGKSAFDSATVAGNSRFGGLVDYNSRVSVKNDATNVNLQEWWNSRDQSMVKFDSTGRITSVGLTTTAAITATGQTLAIGVITSSGKSQLDSLTVVGKIYAAGLPSDSAGLPTGALFFMAADGIVRWKY